MKIDVLNNNKYMFLFIALVEVAIYMFAYHKKGINKSVAGRIRALINAISIVVISLFVFITNFIFIEFIKQQSYWGLILPLTWIFLSYFSLKKIIAYEFGFDIHIFDKESEKMLIIRNFLPVVFMCVIGLCVLFAALHAFFSTLNNKLFTAIPLGILIIIIIVINLMIFRFLIYCIFKYKTYRFNKSKDSRSDIKFNSFYKICILSICFLIGLLLLSIGVKDHYSHKNKEYIKTTGEFFYAQRSSYSEEDYYYLYYSYVANGKRYTVRSKNSVGEGLIPKIGAQKLVLYNKNNPEDAYIKGENTLLIFVAMCFLIIPIFMLFRTCQKSTHNKRI